MATEKRRLAVLASILVVLLVVLVVRQLKQAGPASEGGVTSGLAYTPHALPNLESVDASGRVGKASERNPFRYGRPPTPTPNMTPRPTLPPAPTATPRPTPTPLPRSWPGPPPAFDREYLGSFGPRRLTVAVFRRGGELEVAVQGQVLDGPNGAETFVVRDIGLESVEIGFVGFPEEVTSRVALAEN
jgi:hypothetical protein